MAKPTVGLIVHYFEPCDSTKGNGLAPAIVTKVNEDNSIEITVFGNGITREYWVDQAQVYGQPGCWSWPRDAKGE